MLTQTKSTKSQSAKDLIRHKVTFDAAGLVLGRLATQIARSLMGKNKVTYAEYLDSGDEVVVLNAKEIKLTGKKEASKTYTRYSGYPGGLRTIPFARLKDKQPGEIIRRAVSGMLPKNKLRDKRLSRLKIYSALAD